MRRTENTGAGTALAGLLAVLTLAAPAGAQEDYSTWTGHLSININTRASGGNVPANVLNYPVLVRLDSANASAVFSGALTGGADIRFTKNNNTTRLPFERERWDATARKAEFWVLMDTVKGNDSGAAIRLHWGKAGAADSSKSRAVFATSNGFLAVWHMNQTIAMAGDSIVDATGNGHRGTAAFEGTAVVPANITTGIGVGKNFLGDFTAGTTITAGAYFLINNGDSALNLNTNTGPFTISAWARPAVCDATSRMGLITKYANVNTNPLGGRAYCLQTANVDGNWRLTMDPIAFAGTGTTAVTTEYVADVSCVQDEWTYLAASYNSNGVAPTADETGAQSLKLAKFAASGPQTGTPFTATQQPASVGNNSNVYIGRIHNADRLFRGGIDEVRISNVERSANWNLLDYEMQKDRSRTVYIGNPPPVALRGGKPASGFAIRATGDGVRFLLPAGAAGYRVTVLDPSGRAIWSGIAAAGARELAWNGLGTSGQRTAPGGYLARITGPDGIAAESKVVLLR